MDLKELRERAGLSPERVAAELDKSLSTVRFWESGKHTPSLAPAETQRLLELYKCSLEELTQAAKESKEKFGRNKGSTQ